MMEARLLLTFICGKFHFDGKEKFAELKGIKNRR
jgi:hypothetical protein